MCVFIGIVYTKRIACQILNDVRNRLVSLCIKDNTLESRIIGGLEVLVEVDSRGGWNLSISAYYNFTR